MEPIAGPIDNRARKALAARGRWHDPPENFCIFGRQRWRFLD